MPRDALIRSAAKRLRGAFRRTQCQVEGGPTLQTKREKRLNSHAAISSKRGRGSKTYGLKAGDDVWKPDNQKDPFWPEVEEKRPKKRGQESLTAKASLAAFEERVLWLANGRREAVPTRLSRRGANKPP